MPYSIMTVKSSPKIERIVVSLTRFVHVSGMGVHCNDFGDGREEHLDVLLGSERCRHRYHDDSKVSCIC